MRLTTPRIVIAGLSGDSGKTLLSLGIAGAVRARGLTVAPYKKGPDYIDASWLGLAAGRPGRNLDTFMMPRAGLDHALARGAGADLALVEGNRGLFDGLDAAGRHSTAELAKRLGAPVLLVVDVTKSTRTVAAQVLGCRLLDRDLDLAGVVLNRVATARQERVIRTAVESDAGVPVLGAIPRLEKGGPLPGRHLGLVTVGDHPDAFRAVDRAVDVVRDSVDVDAVLDVARRRARIVELTLPPPPGPAERCRVAVARDEAFCFYYPENLEALEAAGAELLWFSPLAGDGLPVDAEGLYLGGGFPEVHVRRLSENALLGRDLRAAVASGLPVYAECGGLMTLARELRLDGVAYPMAGVLDLVVEQTARPQGHGYVQARVDRDNPWFGGKEVLLGHEFHYSRVVAGRDADRTVLALERGRGLGAGRDGIVKGCVWASYLHLHAASVPGWARRFTGRCAGHVTDWPQAAAADG